MEGCRPEPESAQDAVLRADEIAQLSADQGSRLQGMEANDQPIPKQMIGVVGIGEQLQMQVADLVGRAGQLRQRGQVLSIIHQAPGLLARSARLGRSQAHPILGLEPFEGHVGRTEAGMSFAIGPESHPAKLPDQLGA